MNVKVGEIGRWEVGRRKGIYNRFGKRQTGIHELTRN